MGNRKENSWSIKAHKQLRSEGLNSRLMSNLIFEPWQTFRGKPVCTFFLFFRQIAVSNAPANAAPYSGVLQLNWEESATEGIHFSSKSRLWKCGANGFRFVI